MLRCLSVTLIAGALCCAGCVMALEGSEEKLRESINRFNDGVRWGRTQDALSYVDPQSQDHFIELHKEFGKSIRITEYEVVRADIDLKQHVANIGIAIGWYRIDKMEVHQTLLSQRWEERGGQWLMVAETIVGGTPF